jgi:hypothetical protein
MNGLQLADIRPQLSKLAAGGEGVVYSITGLPDRVFKQYKSNLNEPPDYSVLARLVELPQALKPSDKLLLLSRTTWPTHLVIDSGRPCGFLMPALSANHYRRYGLRANPHNVLCDWNQITYSGQVLPTHMVTEIPNLATEQVIALLGDLARTVSVMHQHNIVVGDMSGKNLIWSPQQMTTTLIDCDSFRVEGQGVCVAKESPGWIDPALAGRPTDKSSDVYKMGVAAYRSLWRAPEGQSISPDDVRARASTRTVPPHIVELVSSSLSTNGRPAIEDWVANCTMSPPRPTVSVASTTRVAGAAPTPPLRERPVIRLAADLHAPEST